MSSLMHSSIPLEQILKIIYKIFGPGNWSCQNEEQKFLVNTYQLNPFQPTDKELTTLVANNADEINKFLKEQGLDIQLEPFKKHSKGSQDIGIAAVLHIILQWINKPQNTTLYSNNQSYKSIYFAKDAEFYFGPSHNQYPIIKIPTFSDEVWISMSDAKPHLDEIAAELDNNPNLHKIEFFSGLQLPKVKFDQKPNISWLLGLGLQFTEIVQAVQQDKFALDENGVDVKSGAAVQLSISGCSSSWRHQSPPFIVDQPFYLWLKRDGNTYFRSYFDYDSWEKA